MSGLSSRMEKCPLLSAEGEITWLQLEVWKVFSQITVTTVLLPSCSRNEMLLEQRDA